MSIQTLYTAATGMDSMETKLDVIANNLANLNTTAFKKDRCNFEDLFYRNEVLPGGLDAAGQRTPTGVAIGLGSRPQSTQTDFTQGGAKLTGRQLDMAIQGRGFFQVIDPSGEILYTRSGNFDVNANNQLVVGSATTGRLVEPSITLPDDYVGITVGQDGTVSVRQANQSSMQQVGQLNLAMFVNEDGLLKLGENLYAQTDASNTPVIGIPGQNGLGGIAQNQLEESNVSPTHEIIDLITTQRAFELNSQTVQAGDEMMQLVSNLRR